MFKTKAGAQRRAAAIIRCCSMTKCWKGDLYKTWEALSQQCSVVEAPIIDREQSPVLEL